EPLEGALDLLAALDSHGAKLGIVTSNSSRTVRRWLERNGVASLVHVITGRDLLLPLKPAPDLLTRALETAGVEPDEVVYVGDVEGDFVAAHSAGVGFHGIANSEEARDRFLTLGVREVFSSPAALLIYLNLLPP
ncbi:MAG TPA: HAD-IA family hydrolase, partial [Candidatus Binataceae bacterium]|nr:HAD-IA family hydrolase [Candidatus Binataceae bacterium]